MRSVIPRRTISSASSRWLHWLIGRPEPFGCSQASARIWHTCSALSRGWTPGRGASASRLATLTSSSGMLRQAIQRRRQRPTASTSMGTCSAIAVLVYPMAASSTTRARRTSAWPVLWAHTRRSSSRCSASLNTISGGLGPGMHSTLSPRCFHPSRRSSFSGSPPPFCTRRSVSQLPALRSGTGSGVRKACGCGRFRARASSPPRESRACGNTAL